MVEAKGVALAARSSRARAGYVLGHCRSRRHPGPAHPWPIHAVDLGRAKVLRTAGAVGGYILTQCGRAGLLHRVPTGGWMQPMAPSFGT